MTKNRSRNSLLSSQPKISHNLSNKDELTSMKYQLEKPNGPVYPLDSRSLSDADTKKPHELTYPDFYPWKDPSQLDEDDRKAEQGMLTNSLYLNKGLFEAPQVSNEYYTARNLIQATLFSTGENCMEVLKELSQHLASVYKTRNEVINKIRFESNNFKLPTKVTLTSSKRDAWLKDLADPNIPLSSISQRIPHGIKNKVLVDVVTSRKVPLPRAIWFTKCVLYGDSIAIRKKILLKTGQLNNDSKLVDGYELQWIQEWTQQVMDYLFKFSREFVGVSSLEKKHETLSKLNYLLRYIETLYVECLVDENIVLTSILRFFKEGLVLDPHNVMQLILKSKSESQDDEYSNNNIRELDINYGQRLTGLLLLKVFWNKLIQSDYICKELCEVLLLNYYFINRIPIFNPKQLKYQSINPDQLLSSKLKGNLLLQIAETIKYLFKLNPNSFIIPNYWILICGTLYDILFTNPPSSSKHEYEDTQKQFQLILHRNESLMVATKHTKTNKDDSNNPIYMGHKRANSFQASLTPSFAVENILSPEQQQSIELDSLESELFINRSPDDILKIIDYLDKLKFNEELTKLLRPLFKRSNNTNWKMNLSVSILWCISKYRDPGKSNENILIFCAFLRHKVINASNPKYMTKIKNSIESSILDIVYESILDQASHINLNSLYVLINELYQLQVITISAYLRKLIASGIFNSETVVETDMLDPYIQFHVGILENLPVLNNKQCDNILKKWGRTQTDFNKKFENGKCILSSQVVDKLRDNSLDQMDISFFDGFEIGIKYLLVNWLTQEIKSLFNNSSKLIHVRILTVTLLYNLYAKSDNLAVFFKVVVKNILKNDGKVIIIDMDSLYLISQLMIRHFKLIKTISANDTGSVGFELFKLIMINYKDLTTREPDYYNFKSIWNFIDKSFERITTREASYNPKIQKHNAVPQFIYSKATVDSPMKIDSQNHDEKAFDSYSIDDFSAQLNEFLTKDYDYMKQSELSEILSSFKLPDSLDLTEGGSKKLIVFLIDYYMKSAHTLKIEEENSLVRVLINTRNLLQKGNSFAFVECFSYFVQKQLDKFESNPGKQSFILLLKKLICNEVIDIYLVVHLIYSVMNNEDLEGNNNSLVYDLTIGEKHDEQQSLTFTEILQLEIQRNSFHSKFSDQTLEIISKELKSTSLAILQKDNIMFYNARVNGLLQKWIFTKSRFFMEQVSNYFEDNEVVSIVNLVSNTQITSSDQLLEAAHAINEFNLSEYQILSRLLASMDFTSTPEEYRYERTKDFIEKFIPKLNIQFSSDNSYFGEFFNMLPLIAKAPLLRCICDILFTRTIFSSESITCDFQGHDVLPLFSDFFRKFSVSSIEFSQITGSFFSKLSSYLKDVLDIVEKVTEMSVSINRALAILIRILIIHKESIANYILANDSEFEFLVNLKSLFLTPYMNNNTEKLKILLYDLLLIFKNLFSKECNVDDKKNKPHDKQYSMGVGPTKSSDKISADFSINEDLVDYQTSKYEKFATIFDLPQMDNNNILLKYLDESTVKSSISLDERELSNGGDYVLLVSSGLSLVQPSKDSFLSSETFNLLGDKTLQSPPPSFKIKSFEILENTDKEINNGRLNLLLFDAYTTKQNPP